MFSILKHKPIPPANPWRVVDKFWGGDRYAPDQAEYPNNTRLVDLTVVNGNVGHRMKGFYHDGKWFSDEWRPDTGTVFRQIPSGITVAAWREL